MRDEDVRAAGAALLEWYDGAARVMPWRVGPEARRAGQRPDPYRVWLSEVMLQQTTVAAVRDYFRRFTDLWPDIGALARAPDDMVMAEWAGLGYYARARNLLRCARIVAGDLDGRFPQSTQGLRGLPGIGPYTAAAIAAIAFDEPATVIDGNVERVISRLFAIQTPLPAARPEIARHAERLTPALRPGDHAQAMMDLGATICTPRNPACALCPLREMCRARAKGIAGDLPRKAPKPQKPQRAGFAYVARDAHGGILLERRPGHGLLGGTLGFPGSDWSEAPDPAPPFPADWRPGPSEVRHTFTHFHLRLTVLVTSVAGRAPGFTAAEDFRPAALPTLMRKVWQAAQSADWPQPS